MAELKYWLWLSLTLHQNSRKITTLLERFDTPLDIYNAKKEDFLGLENLTPRDVRQLSNKNLKKTETVMEDCRKFGIRIMTFDSPYYPKRLANIFDPPYVLYVKSRERLDLNETLPIAVIGTRKSTPYGRAVARKLAEDLARAGVLVVSGLARGGDGAAHMGALRGGGKTVAVLGCGLDTVYPPEHDELCLAVAENGMVISEYPPGTPPLGKNFPVRNRIISGLAAGMVVTEAPAISGTLITANNALEQGRDIFAVPGNITDPNYAGCNQLIQEGAHLVTSALDVISEYREEYIHIFEKAVQTEHTTVTEISGGNNVPREENAGDTPTASKAPKIIHEIYQNLPDEEQKILDCLSITPTHVDTLSEKTGLRPEVLNATLTMLEMKGLVKQIAGRHFLLNV